MGLLDALDSEQGRLGLGLLMAAGPQAQPMSLGQRLGQGLGYVQAQKMQDAEQKLRELQMQQAGLGAEQSRLGIKKTGIELTEAERAIADREAQRKILAQFYGNQGMPANPQAMPQAAPQGVSTSAPPTQQPAQPTIPAKVDKFASYVQLGDLMAKQGQPEAAQKWYDIAEKFRPKYSTTPQQVMVGGKLTNVLIGEDGSIKTMDGYDVKPDMVSTDLGGKVIWQNKNAIQPGAAMAKTMTPGESVNAGLAREKFGWEQRQALLPKYVDGVWVTPPNAGQVAGTIAETPYAVPKAGSAAATAKGANKALSLVSDAEKLLDKSTGSYIGAGADIAAAAFGKSTEGARAAAQLKTIEGSLMMAQPRMEGPQSDKDVALYRQMAAQIGDSTVPIETRKAALSEVKRLQQQYANDPFGRTKPTEAPASWSIKKVP
jgi:hypothetical protein